MIIRERHSFVHLPQLVRIATCLGLLVACAFEPQLPEPTAPEGSDAGDENPNGGNSELRVEVSRLFDTITQAVTDVRAFECECDIAGQAQTVEQCVEATLSSTPPPIVDCTKDVLATDEHSVDSLECEAKAWLDYVACLKMSTCSDFDNILDCQIQQDTFKRTTCESLPWDTWSQVQVDCYGIPQPPPFECDDGTRINSEWVCDLENDCEDGSDESNCHP